MFAPADQLVYVEPLLWWSLATVMHQLLSDIDQQV